MIKWKNSPIGSVVGPCYTGQWANYNNYLSVEKYYKGVDERELERLQAKLKLEFDFLHVH